ncbi:MAG: hypothetical protein FWD03_08935, partial [Defluviitaleaceae bacterium]|nr:hypothetical protein [Defluviitaleaceae bacterium]
MQKIKLKIMPLVLSLTLLIGLFSPIAVTADDYPELAYDIESTYNLDPIDVEVVDGSDEASDEYEMEADKDDDDVVSDDDEYLPDLTYDLPDPEEPEEDELDFIEIIDIAPMSITIPGGHILGHEILNESGPFNVAANGHTQRARNTGTNWTANYLFESEITNFNQTGAIRLMVGHMGGDNNIYIEIGTGSSISLSTGGNLGWNWLASGTAPVAWSSNPISVRYAMMVMGNDVSIFVNDTHVLTHTFTAQNALDALAGGGIGWRSNWNSNATFTIANVKVTSIIAGQQGPPVDPLTITLDNDLTGIPEGSVRVASVTGTTAGSTLHYLVTPLPNTIAEPVVGSAITDYTGTTLFTVNTPIGTAVL